MQRVNRVCLLAVAIVTLLGSLNPAQARFLQTDPVGYKSQVNLYAYVSNDPPNRTDPTGMQDALLAAQEDQFIEQNLGPNAATATRNGRSAATIIGSAIVISCAFGCEAVPAILRQTFRLAENNSQIPSTISAQTKVADAAERIAPLARRRGLGAAEPSATGGVKFVDGKGNAIRVEPGRPDATFASGRQPYVKETFGGTVRDASGNPIARTKEFPNPSSNPASHLPVDPYLKRQGI